MSQTLFKISSMLKDDETNDSLVLMRKDLAVAFYIAGQLSEVIRASKLKY